MSYLSQQDYQHSFGSTRLSGGMCPVSWFPCLVLSPCCHSQHPRLHYLHSLPPQAPKCVMGPGTGLGAAQLFWDSGKQAYTVIPGEGEEPWGVRTVRRGMPRRENACRQHRALCGTALPSFLSHLAMLLLTAAPVHCVSRRRGCSRHLCSQGLAAACPVGLGHVKAGAL